MRFQTRRLRAGAVLALGFVLGWLVVGQPAALAEATGQRWAVLIGVNQYAQLGNLTYCVADARRLRDQLIESGFPKENVFLLVDGAANAADLPVRENILRRIESVLKVARKDDLVLVAFSGHGVHLDGRSYFCPADANLDSPETTMVPVDFIYRQLDASHARQKLLLVDACRNDPRPPGSRDATAHKRSLSGLAKDLSAENMPKGILALSSSTAGQISWEDEKLGHGVFMYYVMEGLSGKADEAGNRDGAVSLPELYDYAYLQTTHWVLRNRPGYVQTPALTGEIVGPTRDWVIGRRAVRVEPIKPPPPLAVAPFSAQQARRHQDAWAEHLGKPREITNSIGMKLVLIPPGEFMMGSPEPEEGHLDREAPQHRVRITRPFYFGAYELTQEEYERVMGTNPSHFSRGGGGSDRVSGLDTSRFPVESVSWEDAVEFCRRLSALPAERSAGREYRLPTEAEWEYACRAGTTTRYYHGDDAEGLAQVGNVADAEAKKKFPDWMTISASDGYVFTAPVGSYRANGFGLYDMHGNVREWCSDWFDEKYYANLPVDDPQGPASGSDRVHRGGSWIFPAGDCRSAYRFGFRPGHRSHFVGFRLALVPADE